MPAEPARGRSSRGRTALLETPIVCLAGWLPSCLARLAARETLTRKKNPNPRELTDIRKTLTHAQRKKCATMARKRAPQQKSIRGNLWESMGIYGKPGKNLTVLWESVTAYH